jgi:hypothetical protein
MTGLKLMDEILLSWFWILGPILIPIIGGIFFLLGFCVAEIVVTKGRGVFVSKTPKHE